MSVVASWPMLFAATSRKVRYFSARHMLGVGVGASCLALAAACELRPPEAAPLWRPLARVSRQPGLFAEWAHWFAYVMLGGGPVALALGPVVEQLSI